MADEDYVALASPDDVAALLGRALTTEEQTRVIQILAKASELFRAEAQRQFTGGFAENIFRVLGDTVYLTERPVESVLDVVDDRTGETITERSRFKNRLRLPGCTSRMVRVAYTWDPIVPELVRQTVADIARQVLQVSPEAVRGLTQFGKTVGPYSRQETYATWAQGGGTRLSPEDLAVARRFRTQTHAPVVQSVGTGTPTWWLR